ncbi:MAG: MASE1 domain-containing protein [Chloroflexi bacterium]|nr:MASE1 domain-containing protein [Chloroflexota bacterium]MCL5076138.1 MASE1 domain-containing protein [Chloroflexota bacterium]
MKPIHIAIIAIAAGINGVLDAFGVVSAQIVPGVAAFYPAVAFQIAFGAWFGIWGVLGCWLGAFFGGVISGMPVLPALVMKFGAGLQALVVALAFRAFNVNPALPTKKDWVYYIIFGVVVAHLFGATWGVGSLAAFGIIPWGVFWVAWVPWVIGNMIVVAIITTPLFLGVSRVVLRSAAYMKGMVA